MLYTEKELQDTLKKDVTISKETEKRMQETYAQIRRDTKTSKKRGRKHTSMAAAAAQAVHIIVRSVLLTDVPDKLPSHLLNPSITVHLK